MAEDPTIHVSDSVFMGTEVLLDNHQYTNCQFTNCRIIYGGTGPVSLVGNAFNNCHWEFTGPAASTLSFLGVLYASGGGARKMVEATLENLKRVKLPN